MERSPVRLIAVLQAWTALAAGQEDSDEPQC